MASDALQQSAAQFDGHPFRGASPSANREMRPQGARQRIRKSHPQNTSANYVTNPITNPLIFNTFDYICDMSYIRHIYHIVTSTKYRQRTIPERTKKAMLLYIYKICKSRGWKVYRMNICYDHMHMLVELPKGVEPEDVMRIVKSLTTRAFKGSKHFPDFAGWANGYASFSVSYYEVEHISNYIRSQLEHHCGESFAEECRRLLKEHGIEGNDGE